MGFRCLLVIGCVCFALMANAAPAPIAPQAQLNAQQREWLAQHPQLRVGLVLQAPYAQYDRRLQRLSGANVELMQWLAKALNIDLTWRNFPSQEQLEAAVRDGEVDIAPGLQQTPAGLRLWLFSDPYMRVPQHIVGIREGGGAVELEKLDELSRVAVRMPSAVADYLRSNYPNLNLQGVPLERQALQLLVSQQARYAVVDEAQLSRLSGEAEFAGLAVVGDIGLPQLLRVATRREWPELASIMQSALRAIPARDLDQLHSRWLQPKYPRLTESPGLWQNLSLLLAMFLLASLAVVVWQRRHQRVLEHSLLAAREESAARAAGAEALRLTQFSIDQSTVGILWVNWDSHVRYANRAAETMLGYAAGALIERPLIDFDPTLNMDRWLDVWKRARASEEGPQTFAADCVRADGSILPADVSLSFLRFAEGEYLVVYLNDVTERRRYVAALQQSETQLRELSAHLETVREEEKARIAREVHDELGQMLTVLKLETSMCELAYAQLDPGLTERLNSMKRLIAQLFQLVRDVATALRPPILDAGIASAIEWQARRFEARTHIPCLVQVPDNLPALSDAKAIGLFRILQEALTNVMRHAQAHTVELTLTVESADLRLTISDDGVGFVENPGRPVSFGVVGMRERVLMMGGQLSLHSELGEGTTLSVTVPLDA
ncbi:transporter substrate-binding domain-containing protein [Pseudomonas sp. WS 5532]|uniref:PAS domain-containing sensor histidine kinase n=1 Tax=Pseudomonas TaxID=286 RepID=UPI00031A5496|nr:MULTISPECIES: transporter substrate-binding domain-containing protein [Pseudomonas]MCF5144135.1 transporter substrate-binding domain-containing protein [Pseudomonas sp. PA-6-3C]MCF5146529.1 transporter substrate-binding domain-containing protein [Pseudomonas sp. PA-6-3F]MCF5161304.1 transporter substrate-binding domain-containing protein [Pseudomonas sp. PA-6-2E]MCF5177026.1 transporter substrate-binding domain-containing protein [Pseudomonas sp. PA-6-1D]MCF5192442.1 transporter substrate-b